MDRGRTPVTIDGASGRVIEVRCRHPRRDPVRQRDFGAEIEEEVQKLFEAQRARAVGVAEDFARELAGTLRRAMRERS